ncbi:MAG: tetratricopeptide repeat protein [Bacteroidia bacterium]|nr:tetratricopeptide repeat protein [Bacteroidia bacterium]
MRTYTSIKSYLFVAVVFLLTGWEAKAQQKEKDSDGNEVVMDMRARQELIAFMDACKERSLGNKEEAARKFYEVLSVNPKNGVARYELAKLIEEKGLHAESLALIDQALDTDPQNVFYLDFKGDLLGKLGKLKESIKVYEKIIKIQPSNLEVLYKIADSWLVSGSYEKAIEGYNKVEAIVGVDEQLSIQKEKIWLQLNKLDKAEFEIRQLIDAYPGEVRYYTILAELYRANNLPDKAFEVYQKVEKIAPEDAYLNMQLADYYRIKGEKEKSFSYLKKAFANKNLDIDTKMKVLISYYTLTEKNPILKGQAYELLEVLTATHPTDAKSYAVYGDFLVRDDRFAEARTQFSKCLQLDKKRYPVWSQYFVILNQLGQTDSLVAAAAEAIELFPVESFSYLMKGVAELQLKRPKQAIETLQSGKSLVFEKPELGQFWTSMGDAYNELAEHSKSDSCYIQALKLDPNNANVLNNFSYYLSLRKMDLEKAKEMSQKSNELEPNNSSYQDTYGWILFQLGDYSNAKIWIEKAIGNGGENNGTLLEHLGDVESKLGNASRAVELWQKAKSTGEHSDWIDKKIKEGKYFDK